MTPAPSTAERAVERLKTQFGYENGSAADAAVALVRERLAALLS